MSVSERLEIVTDFRVRMWVADKVTWLGAYRIGYREPRFPVPSLHYHLKFYVNNHGFCHAVSLVAMAKVKAWWNRE